MNIFITMNEKYYFNLNIKNENKCLVYYSHKSVHVNHTFMNFIPFLFRKIMTYAHYTSHDTTRQDKGRGNLRLWYFKSILILDNATLLFTVFTNREQQQKIITVFIFLYQYYIGFVIKYKIWRII